MEEKKTNNPIGLIIGGENGDIHQLSTTVAQQRALQEFVAMMSKEVPLVKLSPKFDLVLKARVRKFNKN